MKANNLPLSDQEISLWAFELVDNQLRECQKENGKTLKISFRTRVGKEVVKILKDHSLVTFSSSFSPGATLIITEKGKDVIAAGCIGEYLKFWKIKRPIFYVNKQVTFQDKTTSKPDLLDQCNRILHVNKLIPAFYRFNR